MKKEKGVIVEQTRRGRQEKKVRRCRREEEEVVDQNNNVDSAVVVASSKKIKSKKELKVPSTTKNEQEKRQFRYRTSCPSKLQDRLLRANTQRMYLIRQKPIILIDGTTTTTTEIQQSQQQPISLPTIVGGTILSTAAVAPVSSLDATTTTTSRSTANTVPTDNTKMIGYDFTVLGSTGNVYTVKLQHVPCCTCPDHQRQQDLCKHIIFILLKVIGLSSTNPLAYQKAYISSELNELYTMLHARRVGGGSRGCCAVMANQIVQARYAALNNNNNNNNCGDKQETEQNNPTILEEDVVGGVKRRELTNDDCDCPICFDTMNRMTEQLTYCRAACGSNFHMDCIVRWLKQREYDKACPNCRQPWIDDDDDQKKKSTSSSSNQEEGYINLGQLQGVSRVRDTSTYHSYSTYNYSRYNSNKRRRNW